MYLVHSLVGKALWHAFDVTHWPAALHTGAAWVLSALLVAALRRAGVPWHELASRARPTRQVVRPHLVHESSPARREAA